DLDEPYGSRPEDWRAGRSPATAVRLLTPNVLRQMQIGDALLLHGQLPPAWLRSNPRRPRLPAVPQERFDSSSTVATWRTWGRTVWRANAPRIRAAGRSNTKCTVAEAALDERVAATDRAARWCRTYS